jgi:CheY-like chemotaxis protein
VAAIASGLAAGDYVVLSVTDSGTGIAPENLARAFEPFFTTKEPGKGSGLGLSMVFGYMRQSGGTAKIYSEPGHGTTVQLYLPRAASPADRRERTDGGETPAAGGGERILVVDDNPDMRGASVAMLRSLGYRTVEAGSAQEALATIETCGPFDLVFSDIVMPGEMTGIDLAHEARRRGIRILLASGFASPVTVRTEAATQGLVVLTKPFRKSDLAAQVRALLRQDPDAGGASLP